MISEFSFEPSFVPSGEALSVTEVDESLGLMIPLHMPHEIIHLKHVPPTVDAMMDHFMPLGLEWHCETDLERGGSRLTGVLNRDRESGGLWTVVILERAGTGKHRHNDGGVYGEFVVTLAGELDDVLDNGKAVTLRRGDVVFHAANTLHEATALQFWVGLCHQPRGSTRMA